MGFGIREAGKRRREDFKRGNNEDRIQGNKDRTAGARYEEENKRR